VSPFSEPGVGAGTGVCWTTDGAGIGVDAVAGVVGIAAEVAGVATTAGAGVGVPVWVCVW
jgi:hypothetical protein